MFVTLDGLSLPPVGLGTWRMRGESCVASILSGLTVGYRLIDTAFNYDNEGAVGLALRRSTVPREEVVIATKLPGRYHAYSLAVAAVEESVMRLGVDDIDLMLIHWPNPLTDRYVEAWQALIDCRARGLVRSIGVSNFLTDHIDRLVGETGVGPSVNQIELHPFFPQRQQVADDERRGVLTQAWSPLCRGEVLGEPTIQAIARDRSLTPTQVVLRWHIQSGVVPIVKGSTPERQAENLDVFDFELDSTEIEAIDALAATERRINGHNPDSYEEY